MRMSTRTLAGVALGILFAASPPASAGAQVEPGLWEIQFDLDPQQQARMAEAEEQLKNLPPAQRQMMERMMASRGMSLAQPNTIRTCITPEQASAREVRYSQENGCQQDVVSQGGQVMKMTFNCPDSEGTATIKFDGNKGYTTEIKGVQKDNGQRRPMQHTLRARWLQADCGDLR